MLGHVLEEQQSILILLLKMPMLEIPVISAVGVFFVVQFLVTV